MYCQIFSIVHVYKRIQRRQLLIKGTRSALNVLHQASTSSHVSPSPPLPPHFHGLFPGLQSLARDRFLARPTVMEIPQHHRRWTALFHYPSRCAVPFIVQWDFNLRCEEMRVDTGSVVDAGVPVPNPLHIPHHCIGSVLISCEATATPPASSSRTGQTAAVSPPLTQRYPAHSGRIPTTTSMPRGRRISVPESILQETTMCG